MRSRLFSKYFFTTALIIIISLAAVALILIFAFNRYLSASNYKALTKICDTVAQAAVYSSDDGENQSNRALTFLIRNQAAISDCDIFVTDAAGRKMVCSCADFTEYGTCTHAASGLPADLVQTAKNGPVTQMTTLEFYKHPHYTAAVAIQDGTDCIGLVVAAMSAETIREVIRAALRLYLFSAILPIGMMFFALYLMTYHMTKPLKQMSQAAKAMARGDFSKRIPVTRDDEIGELAASFNQMTNALVQLEGMRRSFVANVSHELKTPMTTIGGFIDGMIDGTIEPERRPYYLGIVSQEVKRLSRLVQSMLQLAKIESDEFVLKNEPFNFREMLLNVVIGQEQRIETNQLEIFGLDALPDVTVIGDRDLIYQAVYNLVDNAVKFTDSGGTISFGLQVDAKELRFSITNTGAGISPAALPFVFDRFYKEDKSRSANKNSTGLGLYLVKTIIKSHGGTVSAQSVENNQTTFSFTLPLQRAI